MVPVVEWMPMSRSARSSVGILVAVLVGGLVAWAGGAGAATVGPVPVVVLCAAVAYGINWLAFVPAYLRQTERFYDLMGSVTYLTVVVLGLVLGGGGARAVLLASLITVWTARLGSFLVARISKDGSDGRFDAIKPKPLRFLMTWTMQGLWVVLTASCALAAMTAERDERLDVFAVLGVVVWLAGFGIEVVADQQKRSFRADPANEGRFIDVGLWAWSRHPNYFGEIVLWVGVAVIALPALSGWQFVTLVSPVFVAVLLTRISGVPRLEARAAKRWGEQDDYRRYVRRTPVLVPRPRRTVRSADRRRHPG